MKAAGCQVRSACKAAIKNGRPGARAPPSWPRASRSARSGSRATRVARALLLRRAARYKVLVRLCLRGIGAPVAPNDPKLRLAIVRAASAIRSSCVWQKGQISSRSESTIQSSKSSARSAGPSRPPLAPMAPDASLGGHLHGVIAEDCRFGIPETAFTGPDVPLEHFPSAEFAVGDSDPATTTCTRCCFSAPLILPVSRPGLNGLAIPNPSAPLHGHRRRKVRLPFHELVGAVAGHLEHFGDLAKPHQFHAGEDG